MEIHHSKKIVVRQVGNPEPIFAYDINGIATLNTMYSIKLKSQDYEYRYLLGILNSKLIEKYWLMKFKDNKATFPKIKGHQLAQLPIRKITLKEQKPFIEKADLILTLNNQFHEAKQAVLKLLQSEYRLDKISKKLEKFYELEFGEFVKALGIQKLSLDQKADLLSFFEKKKTELLTLKAQIEQTNKEIDEMVFDLYGLTQEEREIVLAS